MKISVKYFGLAVGP